MYGQAPISNETAHGDAWAARIRAKHQALGSKCPCGNVKREDDSDEQQRRAFNRTRPLASLATAPRNEHGEHPETLF